MKCLNQRISPVLEENLRSSYCYTGYTWPCSISSISLCFWPHIEMFKGYSLFWFQITSFWLIGSYGVLDIEHRSTTCRQILWQLYYCYGPSIWFVHDYFCFFTQLSLCWYPDFLLFTNILFHIGLALTWWHYFNLNVLANIWLFLRCRVWGGVNY